MVLTGNKAMNQTPRATLHWILLQQADALRNSAFILMSLTFGDKCFHPLEVQNLW
jgi:hypothetical protein